MVPLRSWLSHYTRKAERVACFDLAVAEIAGADFRCLVLNRSELGLMLEFREAVPTADVFTVRDFAAGSIVRVRMIWSRGRRMGVEVSSPPD